MRIAQYKSKYYVITDNGESVIIYEVDHFESVKKFLNLRALDDLDARHYLRGKDLERIIECRKWFIRKDCSDSEIIEAYLYYLDLEECPDKKELETKSLQRELELQEFIKKCNKLDDENED